MNPVSSYVDQYVLSADPVELIRLLYQRGIALVQDARRHLLAGDIPSRSKAINKAYDILTELIGSLREEVAPEFCARLRSLYFYMQQRLLDGNLKQEEAPLNEVLQLFITLSEAWAPAAQTKPSEEHAEENVYAAPPIPGRTVAQAYAA